jgi:hypothetical protein
MIGDHVDSGHPGCLVSSGYQARFGDLDDRSSHPAAQSFTHLAIHPSYGAQTAHARVAAQLTSLGRDVPVRAKRIAAPPH